MQMGVLFYVGGKSVRYVTLKTEIALVRYGHSALTKKLSKSGPDLE